MPARAPVPNVIHWRFIFNLQSNYRGGFGLYTHYSGGAPGGADMVAFADFLAGAWNNHLGSFLSDSYSLIQVAGLDLTSATGASGEKDVAWQGTNSNQAIAVDSATLVNFRIARHYRGGKPRVYLPIGSPNSFNDTHTWSGGYTTAVLAAWEAMMGAIIGNVSNLTTLDNHVNVSYISGFKAVTDPVTGRARNVPVYRTTPLVDDITGYSVPAAIASQRRRVLATGK